ncbi:OmpA family protein [Phenylobacterium sp.]|uniref:OmpA family protein n=1 Tax=Phenylobacterium sp. TaxID=1871053 RepID=UPI00301C5208
MSARTVLAVTLGAGLLAGCASSSVSLLQDAGGGTGAVAVLDAQTESELGALTEANTQARLGGGALSVRPADASRYADLMAWLPAPPRVYVMYFKLGTTELDPGSQPVLAALREIVNERSDVQITGHTDTVGASDANDRLSLDRAVEIRAALTQLGLPLSNAKVSGRGERELLVPTADGVAEPANRRVEVIVR